MKTRLLVALLFAITAMMPHAVADEWTSDKYRCALTIPTHESWTKGTHQRLPAGEVILHAVSMEINEGIIVAVIPDMPSTNLRDPQIEHKIQELLVVQGWNLESGQEVTWQGRQFLQFIGRRRDAIYGPVIGVSRVTIRAGDLYIVIAYGKGEPNRAQDPRFLRVINTFHFTEKRAPAATQSGQSERLWHQIAMAGCAAAAGLLIAAFGVTMFFSRRAAHHV